MEIKLKRPDKHIITGGCSFTNCAKSWPYHIKEHNVFKLTDYQTAVKQADIIVFLVAHDAFKTLDLLKEKIVLDFCGVFR